MEPLKWDACSLKELCKVVCESIHAAYTQLRILSALCAISASNTSVAELFLRGNCHIGCFSRNLNASLHGTCLRLWKPRVAKKYNIEERKKRSAVSVHTASHVAFQLK